VTRSDETAKVARDYHEHLQVEDLASEADQDTASAKCFESMASKLSPRVAEMSKFLTRAEISRVLQIGPTGKSPGINGLPYEFWKQLHQLCEKPKGQTNKPFDVADALRLVYNDIEKFEVAPHTDFTEGWLSLLRKKNDPRIVGNHRPITLLNYDYKIFTKALSLELAETAPSVIHNDQAGFVQGWSIIDQVKLTEAIINYAESEEENGVIVAPDQERAHDKIQHRYLLAALDRTNFPKHFTNIVKNLYYTSVMINGMISSRYKVTRGVRQGDPLSCLLSTWLLRLWHK
jgi:hypothetical protein